MNMMKNKKSKLNDSSMFANPRPKELSLMEEPIKEVSSSDSIDEIHIPMEEDSITKIIPSMQKSLNPNRMIKDNNEHVRQLS